MGQNLQMLFGVFVGIIVVVSVLLVAVTGLSYSLNTDCSGIDNFYTGDGFLEDYDSAMKTYTYKESFFRKNPGALFEEGGDCKSMSQMIFCLGKEYGVDCAYYTFYSFDPTANKVWKAHIGVKCLTGNEWIRYY